MSVFLLANLGECYLPTREEIDLLFSIETAALSEEHLAIMSNPWFPQGSHVEAELLMIARTIRQLKTRVGLILFMPTKDSLDKKILKNYQAILKYFFQCSNVKASLKKIIPVNADVFSFPDLLAAYAEEINKLYPTLWEKEVYILLDTGTQLQNTVLVNQALRYFSDEVNILSWSSGKMECLAIGHVATEGQLVEMLKYFISKNQYNSALKLLNEDQFFFSLHLGEMFKPLINFCKAMTLRQTFDFKGAIGYWSEAEQLFQGHKSIVYYQKEKEHLEKLVYLDNPKLREGALLIELFSQLRSLLTQNEQAAFLVRLYRFREALLKYILNYYAQGFVPKNKHNFNSLLVQLGHAFFCNQVNISPAVYFFLKSKNLWDVIALRNHSFIAHGRQGFSNTDWRREYAINNSFSATRAVRIFIEDLSIILKDIGLEVQDSFNEAVDCINI